MVEALRGEAHKHYAAIRVAQMEATAAREQAKKLERAARPCVPEEVDYKGEYMAVGATVGACFPECEATTLDLVRLLIHENATYRIALNLPLPAAVLDRVAADSEAADHG
jgi:hypothetical protein